MDDREHSSPLAWLETIARPLLRLFAALLIVASLWGIVNHLRIWSRPVKLVVGTAGAVQQTVRDGTMRYTLPFTADTGEQIGLHLSNNSPVLDYFVTSPSTSTIGVRYWIDDLGVLEVHPLVYGQPPIRNRVPRSSILLATSLLGLLLGLALLLVGPPDKSSAPQPDSGAN